MVVTEEDAMGFPGTLVLALFFAVGVAIVGCGGYSLMRAREARDWPTVTGKVNFCRLDEDSDSDGTTWRVKAGYTYQVHGRTYTGDRIAFGYSGSSTRSDHVAIHDKLKHSPGVKVR